MSDVVTYRAAVVFDGYRLLQDHCVSIQGGRVVQVAPSSRAELIGARVDLGDDILCPGLVDLQVNGGDGLLFNEAPTFETLERMAGAHRSLGTTSLLPTLITDTPEKTRTAIDATVSAVEAGVPGIAGLHLEGPHLSIVRKGAHDADLIRAMDEDDLALLVDAAARLPALMLTVAPENVRCDQVASLVAAGATVALGHTDADYDQCMAYFEAGASCATHLFNAMSQLGGRTPGLVGAALASGRVSAGLIADGIHVHPTSLHMAWHAKCGPGSFFLVSDAMACAGSDLTEFELGGRRVRREHGRLTLDDGTLAGADLSLTQALAVMTQRVGVSTLSALTAATRVPAQLMSLPQGAGTLATGHSSTLVQLGPDLRFKAVLMAH